MPYIHRIKEWDKNFENAKSRTVISCSFCPIPNKQDGLGYGKLLRMEDGPSLYAAWIAVVMVASKQESPREGYLTDTGRVDGVSYDPEDLSIKTKLPTELIEKALTALVQIGWMERIDPSEMSPKDTTRIPEGHHGDTPCSDGIHIREQKRTEENFLRGDKKTIWDIFLQEWEAEIKPFGKNNGISKWEEFVSGCERPALLAAVEKLGQDYAEGKTVRNFIAPGLPELRKAYANALKTQSCKVCDNVGTVFFVVDAAGLLCDPKEPNSGVNFKIGEGPCNCPTGIKQTDGTLTQSRLDHIAANSFGRNKALAESYINSCREM